MKQHNNTPILRIRQNTLLLSVMWRGNNQLTGMGRANRIKKSYPDNYSI
jgi:hypothetical protein